MRPPKFEVNVIHEIPNFNENFTDYEFLFHNFCALWYIRVKKIVDVENDTERIDARLYFDEDLLNLKFKIFYSIKFICNKKVERKKKPVRDKIVYCKRFYPGDVLPMEEVLDENCGYLENGVLKIQVLFHMESIISIDEYSMFNFLSPPFNSWKKGHTLTFIPTRNQEHIHCHQQLIRLHCKTISRAYNDRTGNIGLRVPESIQVPYFHRILQILHGVFFSVKFDCDYSKILYFLRIARYFGMGNVTRFLERQLIETRSKDEFLGTLVSTAVEFKLEKLLKVMLNKCESKESLKTFLSVLVIKEKTNDPGIDDMSLEAMKTVAAKIFSFG